MPSLRWGTAGTSGVVGTQAPYPLRHHQEGQGTKYRDVIHVQHLGGKPPKTPLGFDDELYGQVDSHTEQLYVCIVFQHLRPCSNATSYWSSMQHVKIILWFHAFPRCPSLHSPARGRESTGGGDSRPRETEKQGVWLQKNGHSQANHNPSMPLPLALPNPAFFPNLVVTWERSGWLLASAIFQKHTVFLSTVRL